jgi:dethiobiotin synthase
MIRGIFVTGTDTGVGKTWIAAGLVRRLQAAGVGAFPMKAVQTGGVRDGTGRLRAPDLDAVLAAAGLDQALERDVDCAPYVFEHACSPHLAARLAGQTIEVARIVAAAVRLSVRHGAVVVEGAGGVLVPLGPVATMRDLALALGLPVVVVARTGLGTLNHVLLTLEALRIAGLNVAGVVLNDAESNGASAAWIRDDNARTIAERGRVPVLASVPACAGDLHVLDGALAGIDVGALVGAARLRAGEGVRRER